MHSFTAILIALGGAAAQGMTLDGSSLSNCPDGWSSNQIASDPTVYCCPGSSIQIDDEGSCCIGTGTEGPRGSCGTVISFANPSYSQLASAAAASYSGGSSPATNADSMATDSASSMSMTMSSDSASQTSESSESSSSASSGSESGSAAAMTSSTSSAAGVVQTAAPLLAFAAGAAMLL